MDNANETIDGIKFPFDIEVFFERCMKNNNLPKNDFEKQAVLLRLLDYFEDGRKYGKSEVNDMIRKYFDDAALLKRELVNFGYIQRDPY